MLKVLCYLFRVLVLFIWFLIVFVLVFYIVNVLYQWEFEICQEFNFSFDQVQCFIQCMLDVMKEFKYIVENCLMVENGVMLLCVCDDKMVVLDFELLFVDLDCVVMGFVWCGLLELLVWFMCYWCDNFLVVYDFNCVFLIGSDNFCMVNFGLCEMFVECDDVLKVLYEWIMKYCNVLQEESGNNFFWISQGVCQGVGYFYVLMLVYLVNCLQVLLGVEQFICMENFFMLGSLLMGVIIIDENGYLLILLIGFDGNIKVELCWMQECFWFGYMSGFCELVFKKSLLLFLFSIVYFVFVDLVLECICIFILNVILLNVLVGVGLFMFVWMYEW